MAYGVLGRFMSFVETDEDKDQRYENYFRAATIGDVAALSRHIARGISVNAVDKNQGNLSAIHLAVTTNAVPVIDRLFTYSELDIKDCSKINNQGLTIFHTAVNSNRLELAKRFYELFPYQAYIPDRAGRTVLHTAVANPTGSMEMINYLLSLEINVNLADEHYWTAMMCAVQKPTDGILKSLIEYGADVNEPHKMNSCVSPLKVAIQENKLDNVITLLNAGAKTQFEVLLTMNTRSAVDDSGRHSKQLKTENLATFAIKNIDLSSPNPNTGIKIAYEVVKASAEPPAVEAIFELYGRYILKSPRGQRQSRQQEIDFSRENNTISDRITDLLLQVVAASLACCQGVIKIEDELIRRFHFDSNTLNRLLTIHEDLSSNHMATLAIRKQLVAAGYGNVTEALRCANYQGTMTELATLDWCFEQYVLRLDKRDRPGYYLL